MDDIRKLLQERGTEGAIVYLADLVAKLEQPPPPPVPVEDNPIIRFGEGEVKNG